jgi:t-SNARE complex subunit (syntaxin)
VFETKENTLDDMEKNEIIELNKNINDLKNIFINVQNMVVQQGDIIDRIDVNIEQTMNYVDDVRKKLIGKIN